MRQRKNLISARTRDADAPLPVRSARSAHDDQLRDGDRWDNTNMRMLFEADIIAMTALAALAADSDCTQEIEQISAELTTRISIHLSAGRDDVLNRALGAALMTHGKPCMASMLEMIEEAATSWISSQSEGRRISTTVAVIPVYITRNPLIALPRSLESDASAFNDLTESLRRHGLVRPQGCVFVLPGIYTREEIETVPFSRIFRLARHMTAVVDGEGQLDVPDIKNRESGFPENLSLRYILVGHRDDEAVYPFLPCDQDGADLSPQFEAALMDWTSDFGEIVRRCIGASADTVMAAPPEPFFLGLRTGAHQYRTAMFHLGTQAQLGAAGVGARDVRAVVDSLCTDKGRREVVVNYLNRMTGEHVGSIPLPALAWTSLDVDKDVVLQELANLGIGHEMATKA